MSKYRKKPVTVEAEQFHPNNLPWPKGFHPWDGEARPRDMSWGYVITIHGQKAHVQAQDWIVAEPDGEHYYPVKPDIFEATYEPVEEA